MAERRSRKQTAGKRALAALIGKRDGHQFKLSGQVAKMYVVEVVPEEAERFLDIANFRNRRVRQKKVVQFSNEMKAGEWRLQNPLIFSDSGELIDGQHRLLAVIESYSAVVFLVQVTDPREAKEVNLATDGGSPRNLADMLHFNLVPHSARVAPVLVYEKNYRVSHKSPFQSSQATKSEYLGVYRDIGEEVFKLAFGAVPRGMHVRLSINRAVVDWLSLQLVQIDPGDAELFFNLIVNPSQLKESDAPFVLNQKFLALASRQNRKGHIAAPPIEQGTLLVKAWNKYYSSDPTTEKEMRYTAKGDFPDIFGARR